MRLIDADAVMRKANDSFKSAGLHGEDFRKFKRWVNKSPTIDSVEVVRCRDCRWYDHICWRVEAEFRESDYCSYGERASDDDRR